MQHARADGEVERERGERERLAVTGDDLDVRRRFATRAGRKLLVLLERDDLSDPRRECEGERTRAGADVEHPLVAAER